MKSFSRSSLALLSGFVAASVFGMAGEVKAQTTDLQVTINQVCTFTLDAGDDNLSATADDLTANMLGGGGFAIRCNDPDGFTLSAKSNTGSVLSNSGGTATIPYTLTIPDADFTGSGVAKSLTSSDQTVAEETGFDAACYDTDGCAGTFTVTIDPATPVPADTYQSQITWTLLGK